MPKRSTPRPEPPTTTRAEHRDGRTSGPETQRSGDAARPIVNTPMQIFIVNAPGGRIPLVVKGSDTIADVKTMIANGPWGILENDQVLKLVTNLRDQKLEDHRTLSHYNIHNTMVLVCLDCLHL